MSNLLMRALAHRKGVRSSVRLAGSTAWTRRYFVRWLFEDEPRGIAFTPRRWHRKFLSRPGAYADIQRFGNSEVPKSSLSGSE